MRNLIRGTIATLLLALAVSASASDKKFWAQSPAAQRWKAMFTPDARVPELKGASALAFLKIPDPACAAPAREVLALTDAYSVSAVSGRYEEARGTYRKIQDLLATSGACQDTVTRAYALGSMAIFEPVMNRDGVDALPPAHDGITLFLAALINRGNVGFLTSDEASTAQGAYDCSAERIFLDPALHPYDLAAVTLHEIDHLFRDKVWLPGFGDLIDYQGTRSKSKIDWKELILLDEVLALSLSSYSERRMNLMADLKGRPSLDKLGDDLTLYTRGGAIDRLWSLSPQTLAQDQTGLFFLFETFFRNSDESVVKLNLPAKSVAPILDEILGIVSKGYFAGENHADALAHARRYAESKGIASYLMPLPLTRTSFIQAAHYAKSETQAIEYYEKLLGQLLGTLGKPSKMCEAFGGAVDSGELDNYLGRKLRPSERGVRPSERGVRPSERGVRPSERGVRPCLKLESGL